MKEKQFDASLFSTLIIIAALFVASGCSSPEPVVPIPVVPKTTEKEVIVQPVDTDKLIPDEIVEFVLAKNQTRTFDLEGKTRGYFQLLGEDDFKVPMKIELLNADNQDLLDELYGEYAAALVLPESRSYRLRVSLSEFQFSEEAVNEPVTVRLGYTDKLVLPESSVLEAKKDVNGYSMRIWSNTNAMQTIFEARKDGDLKAVLIGVSPSSFQFVGESSLWRDLSANEKRSFNSVKDKTGDGNPDVMLEFFSGGAHCCFTYHTFELGNVVERRAPLTTAHSGITAWNRAPGKKFAVKSVDWGFSYWNISFADSPAPEVVLVFDLNSGKWVPDFNAMRKPAPSIDVLQRRASEARREITLEPYLGEGQGHFEEAFWGEMLNLIYTGHETLAWRYFDMVWPRNKSGKEIFRREFKKQLGESEFWKSIKGKSQNLKPRKTV